MIFSGLGPNRLEKFDAQADRQQRRLGGSDRAQKED